MGITYDARALLAAEANRVDMWALHRDALRHQVRPVVPAPVLAQAWRGGPQHNLSRLLRGCDIAPMKYAPRSGWSALYGGVDVGHGHASDDGDRRRTWLTRGALIPLGQVAAGTTA